MVALGIDGIADAAAIGSGGNAVVYRARDTAHDRWVAVKVMRGADDDIRRRFDRERRAMGRLSDHDGIVTIHSSGFTDAGDPYLVMGLYEDGSLQDLIDSDGPMPWRVACNHMAMVAETLHYAHERHVLHRDLKPSNVLVSPSGRPALADFGISRLTESATGSVAVTFTPSYCPPEVVHGAEPSVSADVYGLAATLFALLAAEPPFETRDDESIFSVIRRVADDPVPDLRPFGVPEAVCAIVERGMAKQASERHPTAAGLAEDLRRVLVDGDHAGSGQGPAPRSSAAPSGSQAPSTTSLSSPDPPAAPSATGRTTTTAPVVVEHSSDGRPATTRRVIVLGIVAAAVAVIGVAFAMQRGGDTTTPAGGGDPGITTTIPVTVAEPGNTTTSAGDGAEAGDGAPAVTDAESPATDPPAPTGPFAAPAIQIGTVLPETGPLAFLSGSLVLAVELAVEHMNEAGGDVQIRLADSASDRDVVVSAIDEHLAAGTHAVVGPASASVTLAVLDSVANAELGGCSPTASSDGLADDSTFFFRTAPPQALINRALAALVAGDGARTATVLHSDNLFDQAAADAFAAAFERAGGQMHSRHEFGLDATSYPGVAAEVAASDADAIVIIAVTGGGQMVDEVISAGRNPATMPLYVSEGFLVDELAPGLRGVTTAVKPDSAATFFHDALASAAPGDNNTYAAHAYDCAVVIGLAALQAQSPIAADWIGLVNDITRDGAVCTTYGNCASLIEQGENIDYDGASGPLEFSDVGEPTIGVFDVFEIAPSGNTSLQQQITVRG